MQAKARCTSLRLQNSSVICRADDANLAQRGRGRARGLSHDGLQRVRFAKTAAPNANQGRRLEQVGVPGTPCENRRASRLPVRAAKNGSANEKAAVALRESLRPSSQGCTDGTPIPVTSFGCDVGSIAKGGLFRGRATSGRQRRAVENDLHTHSRFHRSSIDLPG